jgi:hypothetical protein
MHRRMLLPGVDGLDSRGRVRTRRALTLLEIVVVCFIATLLLIPLLNLSSRDATEHQEIMRRSLAHGLCMEMLERFCRYKPAWKLPGEPGGPPLSAMYLPVELDVKKMRSFDQAYLEQMKEIGMNLKPDIKHDFDPKNPLLFLLTIRVGWKGPQGQAREVKFSRYCYTP